jgi:release factor glutamine methyltransferase
VLGNPPYVAEADRATLAPDVVHHEPEGALFAGVDGLDVLRRLVVAAAAAAPVLVVEIGAGQAAAVEELLRAAGWSRVRRHRDLAGIERVLEAHR